MKTISQLRRQKVEWRSKRDERAGAADVPSKGKLQRAHEYDPKEGPAKVLLTFSKIRNLVREHQS